MFTNEIKVEGNKLLGRIKGNWSHESHYAFELEKIASIQSTFGEKDLELLIEDLTRIKDKITEMNKDYSWI